MKCGEKLRREFPQGRSADRLGDGKLTSVCLSSDCLTILAEW